MNLSAPTLKPRKSPVQARSTATIDILHAAAFQVLKRDGLEGCTTTRIAVRAGLSVGSLYQYYPNRDALLAAILEAHLEEVAGAVGRACHGRHGGPVSEMAAGLTSSFLAAKLGDSIGSKALYTIAAEHGGPEIVARIHARMVAAIAAMLATAPDARFDDPMATAAIALNALAGPVRAFLEGHTPPGLEADLERQLTMLLSSYLEAHKVSAL